MEKQNVKKKSGGRKNKIDPVEHFLNIRLTNEEKNKFDELFNKSGVHSKTKFVKAMIFGKKLKVVKIDKASMDYYMRLTNFYHQYQAIGNNYNQTLRTLKSTFGVPRALQLMAKLEKYIFQLIVLNKQIIELTEEYEEKYLRKSDGKSY